MSKVQIGKFKAGGQEYQRLQINRTLGQNVGDQSYLGRFYSFDGNHDIAISIHDVTLDTITQYHIYSTPNVENGVWTEIAPTSTVDRNNLLVEVRTDGNVISLRVTQLAGATGSKELRIKCLNLRRVAEQYLRESETGVVDGSAPTQPMPQMPQMPHMHMPPVSGIPAGMPQMPPMPPAPAPMQMDPANVDTRWLSKTVVEHVAAPAPHVAHEIIARKDRPGGYAGLDHTGKIHEREIPRGSLTIVVGDKSVVYNGANDVTINLGGEETAQALGISIVSSLDGHSAATDNDIAALFDDDPATPYKDPDDPGYLVVDENYYNQTTGNAAAGSEVTEQTNTSGCQCCNHNSQQANQPVNPPMTPHMVPPVMHPPVPPIPPIPPIMHPHLHPMPIPPVPPMPRPHFPPPPPPRPQQGNSGCNCHCNCNNGENPNPNPAPESYNLVLNKNFDDFGAVSGAGSYSEGTSVAIEATPNEGYAFVKWNDENADARRTIIMPAADTEYTAYFGYTLTVSSNDDSMGTAFGSGNFLPNEVITIEAHPSEGYHLLRWSDLDSDDEIRSVTISDNLDIIAYFEEDIRQYTVTLTKNEDDYGEVTGAGVYNEGEDVTITATPNSGYKFVKWSDDVEDAERTFEDIHENINLQAEFQQLNLRSITASIKPNDSFGYVTGTGDYERGTVITLTAVANPGYKFVKWMTGDALAYSRTYTDNPLEYTVSTSTEFRAYFTVDDSSPEYTLSLHTNDEALGTVEGAGEYPEGAEVSIAANPIGDNVFVRWNDNNTENPRTIIMPGEDTWYVAYFGNASSGEITEVEGEHPENTKIIQAFPAEGYHFVRWNDGNQENPRTVPADLADTFTAVFEPDFENPQLDVSVNSEDRGSVNTVGGIYEPFAHVQLLATPKTGFAFMGWSDGVSENPRTVVMDDSYNVKALFDVRYYTLTLLKDVDEHGLFDVDPQGPYTYNQRVSITPLGTEGYHFLRWDDYLYDSPRIVNMTEDKTMTAFFERDSYTLTLQANDDTMCESLTGAGTYVGDEPFQISAKAKDGFMFVKWNDECDQATRTYSLTNNTTLTAIFDILKYYITVTVPPSNVSMVTLEGEGYYLPNTQATLKATVLPGNAIIFDKWNDGNTDNPRTVTVTSDKTYTASFAMSRNVTLSVNDPSMGTIQTLVNGEVVNEGTGLVVLKSGIQAVFKAIPTEGFAFKNWSGLMSDSTNPRPVNINGNYTIQANFEKAYYTITVRSNDISTGYVTGPELAVDPETGEPLGEQQSGTNKFTPGSQVVISATPANTYYRFVNWNDGNKETQRTVTVSGNDTYTAYFELDTFRIKVTSNNVSWGTVQLDVNHSDNSKIRSVEDDGTYVVDRNATLTFIANPKTSDGYRFAYWSDNESMTSRTRSFSATSDKTITAIFARENYNVSLAVDTNSSNTGTGTVHIEQGDSSEPVTGPFVGDSKIILVATPDEGYEFNYWSDNNNNHDNPREYIVTKNITIYAYFTGKPYTITARSADTSKGSVSLYKITSPNSSTTLTSPATVAYGTTVKLIAKPATGYGFKEWNDYNNSVERTYQIPAHNTEFIAYFEPLEYQLNLNVNNAEYGYVTGAGLHAYGSTFTIEAVPYTGYEFTKWSDGKTDSSVEITMPAQVKTLTATFSPKQYDLTVTKNNTGRSDQVSASITSPSQSMSDITTVSGKKAAYGATVTLTPKAATGGVFVKWDDGSTGTKTFTMPAAPVSASALFGQSITCTLIGNYTGCSISGLGNYVTGSEVVVTAVPAPGYAFFGWGDGDKNISKTITVEYTNIQLTAIFSEADNPPSDLIIRNVATPSGKITTVTDSVNGSSTKTTLTATNPSDQFSDYTGYLLWPGHTYTVYIAYKNADATTAQGLFITTVTATGDASPVIINNPVTMISLSSSGGESSQGIYSANHYKLFDHIYSGYNCNTEPDMYFQSNTKGVLLKTLDVLTSGTQDDTYDLVLYGSNNGTSWTPICSGSTVMTAAETGATYRLKYQGIGAGSYSWKNYPFVRRMRVNSNTTYRYFKLSCSNSTVSSPIICEAVLSEAYWVD